jgi:hypothetical protein
MSSSSIVVDNNYSSTAATPECWESSQNSSASSSPQVSVDYNATETLEAASKILVKEESDEEESDEEESDEEESDKEESDDEEPVEEEPVENDEYPALGSAVIIKKHVTMPKIVKKNTTTSVVSIPPVRAQFHERSSQKPQQRSPPGECSALCNSVVPGGSGECRHGTRCRFAHTVDELKPTECSFNPCKGVVVGKDKKMRNKDRGCSYFHKNGETKVEYMERRGLVIEHVVPKVDKKPETHKIFKKPEARPLVAPRTLPQRPANVNSNWAKIAKPEARTSRWDQKPDGDHNETIKPAESNTVVLKIPTASAIANPEILVKLMAAASQPGKTIVVEFC